MKKSDAKWKARIYKDKVLKPAIKDQLQILSQVVLCSKELKIEYYKDIVYADGKTKLFDQYPSCKQWEHRYCPAKGKKYRGYVTPGGYMFFGDSENDLETYQVDWNEWEKRIKCPACTETVTVS